MTATMPRIRQTKTDAKTKLPTPIFSKYTIYLKLLLNQFRKWELFQMGFLTVD